MTKPERENAATFLEFTTVNPFLYHQANYKCFYCDKVYTEVHSVLQHSTIHTTPNRYSLLTDYITKSKRVIKVDISGLKCKICELKYSKLDDIRKHLITAHKKAFTKAGNGLMPYNLGTTNNLMSCHICDRGFTSFFTLNRHMNDHDNVICETCGLGFSTHQRLRNHRIVHQNGTYKCEKCEVVCTTQMKLRYHVIRYHETGNVKRAKPLKCAHCLERFSDHYKKVAHLKLAHGISFSFECPTCRTVFTSRRALTAHTRKLHIQNIQCKICGKCFGTPAALRCHMRGHVGERNFVCAICQKAYMHEKLLRKHMQTHGFMFACLKCGNGFSDKNDLIKHQKQWHTEPDKPKSSE